MKRFSLVIRYLCLDFILNQFLEEHPHLCLSSPRGRVRVLWFHALFLCSRLAYFGRWIVILFNMARDEKYSFVFECSFRVSCFNMQSWLACRVFASFSLKSRRRTDPSSLRWRHLPKGVINFRSKALLQSGNRVFKSDRFKRVLTCVKRTCFKVALHYLWNLLPSYIALCEYKIRRVNHLLGSIIKEGQLNINLKNVKEVIF